MTAQTAFAFGHRALAHPIQNVEQRDAEGRPELDSSQPWGGSVSSRSRPAGSPPVPSPSVAWNVFGIEQERASRHDHRQHGYEDPAELPPQR